MLTFSIVLCIGIVSLYVMNRATLIGKICVALVAAFFLIGMLPRAYAQDIWVKDASHPNNAQIQLIPNLPCVGASIDFINWSLYEKSDAFTVRSLAHISGGCAYTTKHALVIEWERDSFFPRHQQVIMLKDLVKQ